MAINAYGFKALGKTMLREQIASTGNRGHGHRFVVGNNDCWSHSESVVSLPARFLKARTKNEIVRKRERDIKR